MGGLAAETPQRLPPAQPLNRLHGGYPFIRAATTILVRDLSANLTILDIVRGSPSIYVTWPGYDEVAHHSGPWTNDAFGELERYDRVIARVRQVIKEKAPRPYDLIILSDHGQSFGPTFKMRYGVSLKEFIEQQLPTGTTVSASMGGDTGMTSLTGLGGELNNVQQQGGGAMGSAVAKQGQKLIDKSAKEAEPAELTKADPGDGLRQRQPGPGLLRPVSAQDQAERVERRLSWDGRRAGATRRHRPGLRL